MNSTPSPEVSQSKESSPQESTFKRVHRWIQRAFFLWAVVSTLWLANSVRTQGVDPAMLRSTPQVEVVHRTTTLEFLPTESKQRESKQRTALIFLCGSGIAAEAYAPLLRPIADKGYPVFIVKLPYRFAPFESHKQLAANETIELVRSHPEYSRWVLAGHSLGAALACRAARDNPQSFTEMVLVATTHPKNDNLSFLTIPVTKIYGSRDGIAILDDIQKNKHLLPVHTSWVEIQGANHSQFGHYGHQLFDRKATITREEQQQLTRMELIKALDRVERSAEPQTKESN